MVRTTEEKDLRCILKVFGKKCGLVVGKVNIILECVNRNE